MLVLLPTQHLAQMWQIVGIALYLLNEYYANKLMMMVVVMVITEVVLSRFLLL